MCVEKSEVGNIYVLPHDRCMQKKVNLRNPGIEPGSPANCKELKPRMNGVLSANMAGRYSTTRPITLVRS